ncbi:MAG: hypothetical protein J7495_16590 [Sphingomonas sp.]|nr:hypothetical protein [Sphingomonas sp.]
MQKRIQVELPEPVLSEREASSTAVGAGGPVGDLIALLDARFAETPRPEAQAMAIAYPAPRFDPIHSISVVAGYAALGAALFGLAIAIGLI